MGAIKNSPSNNLFFAFRDCALQHIAPGSQVCVALSGGVDSVVLLHLFAELRIDFSLTLTAVHIHHGLSPNADHWAFTCQQLCADLDIPLQTYNLTLDHHSPLGIEAAARQARYAQFAKLPVDFIALGHHRDDQAETFLLQLLRGAGVKGLAAMPVVRQQCNHPAYFRPLLDQDRSNIIVWANQHQLRWIEDESNCDTRYARNFLRHDILPLLSQRYPAWRTTIARSAQNMAEATLLLDELAQLDAVQGIQAKRINCTYLASLSQARARNLLRYFLSLHQVAMPSQLRLTEMLRQLVLTNASGSLAIEHAEHTLYRYQSYGYLVKRLALPASNLVWRWQGETQLVLPELDGTLYFEQRQSQVPGLSLFRLNDVNIRLRQGGETFHPDCHRPNRTLKSLLQTVGLPPWQRKRTPLIYNGETLVYVPGIGAACNWQAAPDEHALHIIWRPNR